jgi:hypothetical protein
MSRDLLTRVDTRGRLHLLGVVIGAVGAIWAAIESDWLFAIVLGVATVLIALGVVHRIRQSQSSGRG